MSSCLELIFPIDGQIDLDRLWKHPINKGKVSAFLNKSDGDNKIFQSLLFQIAMSYNSGSSPLGKVLIITKSPWENQPLKVQEMPDSGFINLSLLNFVFPPNFDELCQFLTNLITSASEKNLPDLVILTQDYFEENSHRKNCKILSLVRELANRIYDVKRTTKSIQCIAAFPDAVDNLVTKLHFFVNEVWSLENDQKRLTSAQ